MRRGAVWVSLHEASRLPFQTPYCTQQRPNTRCFTAQDRRAGANGDYSEACSGLTPWQINATNRTSPGRTCLERMPIAAPTKVATSAPTLPVAAPQLIPTLTKITVPQRALHAAATRSCPNGARHQHRPSKKNPACRVS